MRIAVVPIDVGANDREGQATSFSRLSLASHGECARRRGLPVLLLGDRAKILNGDSGSKTTPSDFAQTERSVMFCVRTTGIGVQLLAFSACRSGPAILGMLDL